MRSMLTGLLAGLLLPVVAQVCPTQQVPSALTSATGARVRVELVTADRRLDARLQRVSADSVYLADCDTCQARSVAFRDVRVVDVYDGRHPTVGGVLARTILSAGVAAGIGYFVGRNDSRHCSGDFCGVGGAVLPAMFAIGGGAAGFVWSVALPPPRWRRIWP